MIALNYVISISFLLFIFPRHEDRKCKAKEKRKLPAKVIRLPSSLGKFLGDIYVNLMSDKRNVKSFQNIQLLKMLKLTLGFENRDGFEVAT